jgi:hypothetical protein
MTQQELDKATLVINKANIQLQIAMDKLDTQERIIAAQEEMIQLLQHSLKGRELFITVLENQLNIQDNVINKAKQILKG